MADKCSIQTSGYILVTPYEVLGVTVSITRNVYMDFSDFKGLPIRAMLG